MQDQIDASNKSFLTVVSERQNAVAGKINGIAGKVDKQIGNAKNILSAGFDSITKVYDERVNVLQKEKAYKEAKNNEKIAAKDKELEGLFAKVNKNDKSKEVEKLQAEQQASASKQSGYNEQAERYRKQYDLEKTEEPNGETPNANSQENTNEQTPTTPKEPEKEEDKSLTELLARKLELEKNYREKLVELDEEGKEKKAEEKELSQEEALERIEMLEEMSNIEGEIAKKKEEEIAVANLDIFNSEQFVLDEKVRIEAEKKALQEQGIAEQAELDAKIQKEEEKKAKVERIKKKAEFVVGIAEAISNVAKGAANALGYGPFIGPVLAAMVAASGAVQVGIMTQQLKYMEDGGLLNGKRHSQGGMRILGSNIEVEGGEYVVNRESTSKNLGLINYINSQRKELKPADLHSFFGQASSIPTFTPPSFVREMENGGRIPSFEPNIDISNSELLAGIQQIKIEPRVSVTDINTVHDNMVKVDEWVGL